MLIGIYDCDLKANRRKIKFPNLALMKISAYHKARGDTVEWFTPLESYDKVYSSKIFTFTPENPFLPKDTIRGGTGYDIKSKLPPEIDDMYPDYSIYPECDYAVGFLTRGCIRNCPWCVVPLSEGQIKAYRSFEEVARLDSKKIVLLDNNILACDYGIQQLRKLSETSYKIDFNQGLDCRLVTAEIADILLKIKWIKYIRFSCDYVENLKYIENATRLLGKHGIKPYRIFVCMLVENNLKEAEYIAESLRTLGVIPFAQPYRDFENKIEITQEQRNFARWVNHKAIFNTVKFSDYKRNCKKTKSEEI